MALMFPRPRTSCGNVTSLWGPSISPSLSDRFPPLGRKQNNQVISRGHSNAHSIWLISTISYFFKKPTISRTYLSMYSLMVSKRLIFGNFGLISFLMLRLMPTGASLIRLKHSRYKVPLHENALGIVKNIHIKKIFHILFGIA